MKKTFFISLLLGLLASCTTIEFDSPQPMNAKNLKEFPKEMRGRFHVKLIDNETDNGFMDTIEIKNTYYEESLNGNRRFLSDSMIIRKSKEHYYFNGKFTKDKFWTVGQIIFDDTDGFKVYAIYDNDDEEEFIERVNIISSVRTIKNPDSSTDYIINPTLKELNKLVKKGFFKPVYEFRRLK